MQKIVFISIMMIMISSAGQVSAEEIMSVDKALKKTFKGATDWERKGFVLTDGQVAQIEDQARLTFNQSHAKEGVIFTVRNKQGIMGYALEDVVVGKWGPIHYLVGIDLSGKIVRTSILGFYEIRGRGASKNRFLKQYKGKTFRDAIRIRKDIDGISGATITSRSLTDGVRKLLFIFELLKEDL